LAVGLKTALSQKDGNVTSGLVLTVEIVFLELFIALIADSSASSFPLCFRGLAGRRNSAKETKS
jgi:hypothetical protein